MLYDSERDLLIIADDGGNIYLYSTMIKKIDLLANI